MLNVRIFCAYQYLFTWVNKRRWMLYKIWASFTLWYWQHSFSNYCVSCALVIDNRHQSKVILGGSFVFTQLFQVVHTIDQLNLKCVKKKKTTYIIIVHHNFRGSSCFISPNWALMNVNINFQDLEASQAEYNRHW